MSDDLVALKVLIVSDAVSDRDALRNAASEASVVIDVTSVENINDANAACSRLTKDSVDIVFLDNRMAPEVRRRVIDVARASEALPLLISLGSALQGAGLEADGVLPKPVVPAEARTLLDACVRARLPKRVLVIDDSATVRSVIQKVLQSCRYRVETDEASEGAAALEQAAKQRYDVVLLDSNMPGLDSFAVLAAFQRSHAETKLVMLTATNDSRVAAKAHAAGANDVLYKPFYAKDVDAMMSRLYGLQPKAS